jgi:hypothetical protein
MFHLFLAPLRFRSSGLLASLGLGWAARYL